MDTHVGPEEWSALAAQRAAVWVVRCLDPGCQLPAEWEMERLAASLQHRLLLSGTVAEVRGTSPQGVWVVRSGVLQSVTGAGRQRTVLRMVHPGDITGDVPLLLGRPATETVRALTDVQAGFLPADHFLDLLTGSAGLARVWLTGMARRHHRLCEALTQSVRGSAEQRVASLLLREAREGVVSCSQDTLGKMLGLHRPTVNRVLRQFAHEGLLKIGYRQVELLAEERLRERARMDD